MHIIDSHFHWLPKRVLKRMCERSDYPKARVNNRGGYDYLASAARGSLASSWTEWYDIEMQFEHMDKLGHRVDVVNSIGPFSVMFSDLPKDEGRDVAKFWNEEMAAMQARFPDRFWSSCGVPLSHIDTALEVLDHAILDLGLMGVNLPCSIGTDARIDTERLEPFYARVEELDVPLFLHPNDTIFAEMMIDGYEGALHLSLGRVVEVSSAAMRLVFSGLLERHQNLKLVMSHTGGALPYQSGRMDKNGVKARLPKQPSEYLHRMYTDTVNPHAMGIRFAIEYYGIDKVMYGTDYPCWDPATCLKLIDEINLTETERKKLFHDNAIRILKLKDAGYRTAAQWRGNINRSSERGVLGKVGAAKSI